MKYANQLSDRELREIFEGFLADGEECVSLEITRITDDSGPWACIALDGRIRLTDPDDDNETIEADDRYEVTDYDVRVYDHSGNVTRQFREFMYRRFGDGYARDYLLR